MDAFRVKKLKENILIQSRLSEAEAQELAETLEKEVDWSTEFNYSKIVKEALESSGQLRTQVQKSCKIRDGVRIKE